MNKQTVPASGTITNYASVIPGGAYRISFSTDAAGGATFTASHYRAAPEDGDVESPAHDVASGDEITGTAAAAWSGEWTLVAIAPQVALVVTAAEGAEVVMHITPIV